MLKQKIQKFNVIGIFVRTTNENHQAGQDIPALWDRFMRENISARIPNKVDDSIYCIYTDYEKDYTRPYTTILGCKVIHTDSIPEGMVGKSVDAGQYTVHTAKGNIMEGMVFEAWTKIWNSDLDRSYTADFEVHGEKAQDSENAEVDIFVGVR